MAFYITRSKSLVARSLQSRTASILCGLFLLTPLANVAFAADPIVVADQILSQSIPQLQDIVVSMSQGCSGGANGVPPVSWGALQPHGNAAVNAFSAARISLATKKNSDAVQQINSGMSELDTLVNGLHDSCSGGAHGVDPVYYGRYVSFRDRLKERLDTVIQFL
jgi:hypothetical protein